MMVSLKGPGGWKRDDGMQRFDLVLQEGQVFFPANESPPPWSFEESFPLRHSRMHEMQKACWQFSGLKVEEKEAQVKQERREEQSRVSWVFQRSLVRGIIDLLMTELRSWSILETQRMDDEIARVPVSILTQKTVIVWDFHTDSTFLLWRWFSRRVGGSCWIGVIGVSSSSSSRSWGYVGWIDVSEPARCTTMTESV